MAECPRVLGWAPGSTAGRVLRGCRDGWLSAQAGCRACKRSQAVARSLDQVQPCGIFRIRRLAWVTRRAGADRIRKRSVLVEALTSSPSSPRWPSQAISEVARAASCSQAALPP